MVKKIFVMLFCSVCLIIFVSTLHGQGSKNTITLPNGEVVWDLNGEWDTYTEHYGVWSFSPVARNIFKITQQGSSFVGIRMIQNDPENPKGAVAIKGELDKDGFMKLQWFVHPGPYDAKGQISRDGNTIKIDDGEKIRSTLTRK